MDDMRAPITLSAELTINGHAYAVRQQIPREFWDSQDETFRDAMKRALNSRLGEAIVEREQPRIAVQVPDEREDALYREAANDTTED